MSTIEERLNSHEKMLEGIYMICARLDRAHIEHELRLKQHDEQLQEMREQLQEMRRDTQYTKRLWVAFCKKYGLLDDLLEDE